MVDQSCACSKVLLCAFIILHEIVTGVNAAAVKVIFPRYKPDALFAHPSCQHCVIKLCEDLVVLVQVDCLERRRSLHDSQVL